MSQAVDRGREALAVLFPSEAGKVRLLNDDMVTPGAFAACMRRIDERLDALAVQLRGIEGRLDRIEGMPRLWLIVGVALVVVLILAQVGTPFLEALVVARRQGPGDRGRLPAHDVRRIASGKKRAADVRHQEQGRSALIPSLHHEGFIGIQGRKSLQVDVHLAGPIAGQNIVIPDHWWALMRRDTRR